ncbi:MAG: twin-arginine translocase subunit TatC, partial [Blastocatellia bacterium]
MSNEINEAVEEHEGLQMSFLDHLDELRRRLVNSVAAIFIAFILCWLVSDRIFNFLSIPINAQIRKMRIEAQSVNGRPNLNELKENELAQY